MPIPTPQWDELPEKNNSCPNVVQNHHHAMSHKCTVYLKTHVAMSARKSSNRVGSRMLYTFLVITSSTMTSWQWATSFADSGVAVAMGGPMSNYQPFCDDEQNFFVLRYNLNLLQVRHTIIHGITHFLVGPSTPRPDRRSCLPPGHVWNWCTPWLSNFHSSRWCSKAQNHQVQGRIFHFADASFLIGLGSG